MNYDIEGEGLVKIGDIVIEYLLWLWEIDYSKVKGSQMMEICERGVGRNYRFYIQVSDFEIF